MLSSEISKKGFGVGDALSIIVIVSVIGGLTISMLSPMFKREKLTPIDTMSDSIVSVGEEISKFISEVEAPNPSWSLPQLPSIPMPSFPSLPAFGMPPVPKIDERPLVWQMQLEPCTSGEYGNHWNGNTNYYHCLVREGS